MKTDLHKIINKYPELLLLKDQKWRLNNLYYIKDKEGKHVHFKLNWAQEEVFDTLHPCEIVLKCRQIGMTTFFSILALDNVLWSLLSEKKVQAGIIAHTLEDASNVFKDKLKYAYDHLHPALKVLFKTNSDSAKELSFNHGSLIRVGTSLRSSTLQSLHISEFGKVCAKHPDKAREIISGSLNTIQAGQNIWIESTAEGNVGRYYEMCQTARNKTNLGITDFKFRFFPWWRHPEYSLDENIEINADINEYFDKLELEGIKLTQQQKSWYFKKWESQRDDMLREYPSTPDEAFQASKEGFWYAPEMISIRNAGHVTNISYDRALPVHTASDLGQHDAMCTWFFQINRSSEIMIIDYFERTRCAIDQYAQILQSKGYTYGMHIWPHDANASDRAGYTFVKQAAPFGLSGYVLDNRTSLMDGINMVRTTLGKCWFDNTKCARGIQCLESYGKKWSNQANGWSSEPNHNEFSHGADAFRYLALGIEAITNKGDIDSDYKALRNYWGG